jgi:hypothetical protein
MFAPGGTTLRPYEEMGRNALDLSALRGATFAAWCSIRIEFLEVIWGAIVRTATVTA